VATLLNGIFGDPLLHVRLAHQRRSLVLDLGEGRKLPARIVHQTTDVCISHAHIDHIGGFMPFLRARIGQFPACRVFGPPGLARNVAGFVAGIHWDRAGPRAPHFEVTELHSAELVRFLVAAGRRLPRLLGTASASDGVLFADEILRVRAVVLDHLTPVLAYALESHATLKVRKERLEASGLRPGPWLTSLKHSVSLDRGATVIVLPDGRARTAAELAQEFIMIEPGQKLVYATDLADTHTNRTRLCALADRADALFCEAVFCAADADRARRTGHLTARACGEIASGARVRRLFPFHFSRRYRSDPAAVYAEIQAACPTTLVPWLPANPSATSNEAPPPDRIG
jgi:ribonuclease Z